MKRHRRLSALPRRLLTFAAVSLLVVLATAGLRFAHVARKPPPSTISATALASPDGDFATVGGSTVYFEVSGPGDGPVVVLIHGLLGSSANFTSLRTALAAQGFRVVAVDRPPFGLSDKGAQVDYTLNGQGDLVVGLMDVLDIKRATLLGHSAGAPVAANIALRHPERVDKLILVSGLLTVDTSRVEPGADTSGFDNPALPFIFAFIAQGANPSRAWAAAELREAFSDARLVAFQRANYRDPPDLNPEFIDRLTAFTRIQGWEDGFRAYGRAFAGDRSAVTAERLSNLTQPTLLIWCKQDPLVSAAIGRALDNLLPNARLVEYDDCGHVPWEERPSEFERDIRTFLR
jgi:pimeloyl-ACP methyl ester carboxylesterase